MSDAYSPAGRPDGAEAAPQQPAGSGPSSGGEQVAPPAASPPGYPTPHQPDAYAEPRYDQQFAPQQAPQQQYGAPAPQSPYGSAAPQPEYPQPVPASGEPYQTAPQPQYPPQPDQQPYAAQPEPQPQYGTAPDQPQYGAPPEQQQYAQPGQPQYGAQPEQPQYGPGPEQQTGMYQQPGYPTQFTPGYPGQVGPPPGYPMQQTWGAPPRRSKLATWGVVAICVLLVASVVQTVMLIQTSSSLNQERKSADAAQASDAKRLKALESTVKAMGDRSLDSAGVAKQVLPSIFQVIAGDYTGSSFAVGKAPGGGTYLLTNNHVVQPLLDSGSKTVQLERGSTTYSATVVDHDSSKDVAVLKTDENIKVLAIDKTDVQPGEPVIVIGSPLGLNDSVTTGVVSSPSREVEGSADKFIQFDAAINPGNSGGPVMDAKGAVVGIATEKAKDAEGIGLAIPISVPCDSYDVCGTR